MTKWGLRAPFNSRAQEVAHAAPGNSSYSRGKKETEKNGGEAELSGVGGSRFRFNRSFVFLYVSCRTFYTLITYIHFTRKALPNN